MYEDNTYRRRTYGTPENIRIRRFYNWLNNRPLNYGMEDLFPDVGQYTAQPSQSIGQLNSAPVTISGFTMPKEREFHMSDIRPINIDWKRLGRSFYNEFSDAYKLMRLGAENYINGFFQGGYGWVNDYFGGDYKQHRQDYYNRLPEGNWRTTAMKIDDVLDKYARNQSKNLLLKKMKLDKYF